VGREILPVTQAARQLHSRPHQQVRLLCTVYVVAFITFRVRRSQSKMYTVVTAVWVSVCLTVPRRIPTVLHGPGCKLGNGKGGV